MERHVSPLNGQLNAPSDLIVCDLTLREGEQTPGVTFTFEEKEALLRLLDSIGIGQVQIAHPKFSDKLLEFCARVCAMGLGCKTEIMSHGGWDRCVEAIDALAQCRPDIIHSYFPTTPYVISDWSDASPAWIKRRIVTVVEHIKKYDALANVSLLDATRADPDLIVDLAVTAAKAGADRVRIPDTVGVAGPEAVYELARRVVDAVSPYGVIVGVHTHNDFGLALANTLAGIKAGAKLIDASVNGLGDRAGNVAIAELAVALEALYGVSSGLDISRMVELSRFGEKIAGVNVADNKPLVGRHVFSDQSELHFLAQAKQRFAFQGVIPETFGASRSFLFGKLTSADIISLTAERAGRRIEPGQYTAIQRELYRTAETSKAHPIFEDEFWRIVERVQAENE